MTTLMRTLMRSSLTARPARVTVPRGNSFYTLAAGNGIDSFVLEVDETEWSKYPNPARGPILFRAVFEKAREETRWIPLSIERDESDVIESIKTELAGWWDAMVRGHDALAFLASTKFTPPAGGGGGSAGEAGEGGLAPPGMRSGHVRPNLPPTNEVRDDKVHVPPREELVRKKRGYDDEVDESDVVEEAKVRLGKLGSGDVEKRDAIRRREHLRRQNGGNHHEGGPNSSPSSGGNNKNDRASGSNSPIPNPSKQSGG